MTDLGREYFSWVQAQGALLAHGVAGLTVEAPDDEHIRLTTPAAVGEVNFYAFEGEPEIVELKVVSPADPDDVSFFLHFQLEGLPRAQELFGEMADELSQAGTTSVTRILLSCTSGLTTGFFAKKLAEVAQTLSLDYEFEALPIHKAFEQAGDYDAVMLAPQVGYRRDELAEKYPDLVVFEVPGKVFGAYDAGTALRMLLNAMNENALAARMEQADTRIVRKLDNDKRILVLSTVYGYNKSRRGRNETITYRIYDGGEVALEGRMSKTNPSYQDIVDVVAGVRVMGWKVEELDAIGIAVSGIVDDGIARHINVIDHDDGSTEPFDLRGYLTERYGIPVFVDNNANAAAVGCYVSQDEFENVALHRQPTGYVVGGQGTLVDGRLVRGAHGLEGELGYVMAYLGLRDEMIDKAWTTEGMSQLVAGYVLASIAATSPEVIYLAVDLLDDLEALRAQLTRVLPADKLPKLVPVCDYHERILVGEYALCLNGLRRAEAEVA